MSPLARTPVLLAMLCILVSLMALDILTTLIAVVGMGGTELNPISVMLGFPMFIILKVWVSVFGARMIYAYGIPTVPVFTLVCMCVMIGLYTAVCASNIYQIAGQVL